MAAGNRLRRDHPDETVDGQKELGMPGKGAVARRNQAERFGSLWPWHHSSHVRGGVMTDRHDVLTVGRDTGIAATSSEEALRAPARSTIPTRRLNGLASP